MARFWRRWRSAAVLCVLIMQGCNTVAGIGRDLVLLGDGPREEMAREAKRKSASEEAQAALGDD